MNWQTTNPPHRTDPVGIPIPPRPNQGEDNLDAEDLVRLLLGATNNDKLTWRYVTNTDGQSMCADHATVNATRLLLTKGRHSVRWTEPEARWDPDLCYEIPVHPKDADALWEAATAARTRTDRRPLDDLLTVLRAANS